MVSRNAASPLPDVRTRVNRFARRKGTVIALMAVMFAVLLGFVALSVDVGYISTVKTELKRAADAGALAGAGVLIDGPAVALPVIHEYVQYNSVGSKQLPAEDIQVAFGHWNPLAAKEPDDLRFSEGGDAPSAVRVRVACNDQPLFFARIFGKDQFSVSEESVAMYRPRDIMVVLDFSASMNDDSEFGAAAKLGAAAITANQQQIYSELGSPSYGTLTFTPQYVTLKGMNPTNSQMAQINVTFTDTKAQVTSTKTISQVRLRFSNGNTQSFSTSGTSVTVGGTGSNTGKQIDTVWVKSGTNDSNNPSGYGERFDDTAANIKQYFQLTNVPYPYPSGSWDDFINYVKSSNAVRDFGFKKKYGYQTWVNYLLEKRPTYAQTPDLWKTSSQPVRALKDSVTLFLNFIQEVPTDDRVGLSIYTAANNKAVLETTMTTDFNLVSTVTQQRQAGHYHTLTAIGEGMKQAREELVDQGRVGAYKMMVLITDGIANLPTNTSQAKQMVLAEANAAKALRIPIMTISLGLEADATLMQQVADITGGIHFNVPGGSSANDYAEQLAEVFRFIADDRPLRLVK